MPQSNSDPPVRGFQLKMRHSIRNRGRTFPISLEPLKEGPRIDSKERILLEAAERGDKHTIVRCLQPPNPVNINCTDIMGRSAIQIAVDNENVEIVEVLLKQDGVKIGDALLYAIREGVYRIVEMLIDHPSIGRDMLGSDWATHKRAESEESSDYSPDVSPVILAAYCNQFEILQLLLSRGARIVKPHSLSCCCQRCKRNTSEDSLRHSLLRIHTYRALSSPAWISLTSPDPVLTAFKLSRELERLAMCENEFKDLYAELSEQCKKFSCNLLDQCRSSEEVIAVLDKSSEAGTTPEYLEEDGEDGGSDDEDEDDEEDARRRKEEMVDVTDEDREKKKLTLDRFKLALKYEQKQFVAHPHCQQLLASIWYEGIPGWRRRGFPTKVIVIISLICLLPVMAVIYLLLPRSRIGCLVRTPFMKFMYHSASFGVFLFLLILASTNVGAGAGNLKARQQQRGPPPSTLEWLIGAYVLGFVWAECKQLWEEGLKAYVRQWWNWLDFIMLSLYLCTFTLRLVAYVHSHYPAKYGPNILPRTRWPEADPTLVSEGVFAIANVFSFARIIYLFQANPQLGPLQISLGCMLIDIGKFFFIFFLVITSFACGLNQLYYFYSASGALVAPTTTVTPHDAAGNRAPEGANWSATTTGQQQTTAQQQQEQLQENDFENAFDPLDTSFITLFWTLFGLIALAVLQVKLRYIEGFGKVLFGLYNVAARILFLNMLIAMMSKSFNVTVDHADREWKFARSKLWMGYYDDGSTLPPPFNLIVSPKSIFYILCRLKLFLKNCIDSRRQSKATKRRKKAAARLAKQKPRKDGEDISKKNIERRKYEDVMRRLVSRFIHQWKKQLRQDGVSEDDLLEIKQDISSLRYELREDRKRGEFQSALHMENLKRDILRFIGTAHPTSSGMSNGPGPPPPPGPQSKTLSRDSSVDDKIDDLGSYRSSAAPGPPHVLPDDLGQLRRDIVRSLRVELADVARELAHHSTTERGYRGASAVVPPLSGQTPPSLSIPANSELYHTHLYTQL